MASVHLFTEQTDLQRGGGLGVHRGQMPREELGGMRTLPWLEHRAPQQEGEKQKLEGGTGFRFFLKGYLVGTQQVGWSPGVLQDPGGARRSWFGPRTFLG